MSWRTHSGPSKTVGRYVGLAIDTDAAGRTTRYRRGPAGDPVIEATISYKDPLSLIDSVTYGNGASVHYTYDAANRTTSIEHRRMSGSVMLRLDYTYLDNSLPATISETDSSGGPASVVSFTYDARGRLVDEERVGRNAYHLAYEYDQGGNRTRKVDYLNGAQTCYHYDIEDPATYGSANNRLEFYETFDLACGDCSTCSTPQSTTWYYYTMAGNVRRVVTRQEPAVASRKGGLNGLDGGRGLRDGGEVASSVLAHYEATRFEYACNGVAVTYAMGESWDIDVTDPAAVLNPQIHWAREFRYDGARARYLNRPLDPVQLETLPIALVFDLPGSQSVETIYDGDEPYADRPGSLPWTLFAPGIARVEGYDPFAPPVGSVNTDYYHSDMLGTMRTMSSPPGGTILDFNGGSTGVDAVYTAFGEQVVNTFADGASNRYGYVGAYGYQAHGLSEMPFLHVGARYYDPGSGRFLQRDPIGIRDGFNVYPYVGNGSTAAIDPSGLNVVGDLVTVVGGGAGIIGAGLRLSPDPRVKAAGGVIGAAGVLICALGSTINAVTDPPPIKVIHIRRPGPPPGPTIGPGFIIVPGGRARA